MIVSKKSRFGKKRRSTFQNILFCLVFLAVFGSLLAFLIFQNIKINQKRAELQTKLSELQVEGQELGVRKEELQAGIIEVQTEDYQEKILREQGLYKKSGEEVVTVLPAEEQAKQEEPKVGKKKVWWNPRTWFLRE